MKAGILFGLCLGLVLVSQSCEEENQAPEARPTATSDKDEADLRRFETELRSRFVTVTRLQREANEVLDKSDTALDSGNCIEISLVASSLAPRLDRIINQYQKETAWFVAKDNPRMSQLGWSGRSPDLLLSLQQTAAQEGALMRRVSDMKLRLGAAGTACGFVK